jgi:hypothetical protein
LFMVKATLYNKNKHIVFQYRMQLM